MGNQINIKDNLGSVRLLDVYGSDKSIFQYSRVCTGNGFNSEPANEERLEAFIKSLIKNKHLRCFEFCGIIVGVRCPIFVERQLRTYRKPDLERSLRLCAPIELEEQSSENQDTIGNTKNYLLEQYKHLRNVGLKREEARRVLSLDFATEVISFYNLRSLFHVFDERLAPSAQSETTEFVKALYELTKTSFPLSIKGYENARG